MNELKAAALEYARRGWPVLPLHSVVEGRCSCGKPGCGSPGKHPRTRHGMKDASINDVQIESWWKRWPDANIGVKTGASPGTIVLDIDPRNGGTESLAELEAEYGELPATVEAVTGGNGRHLVFQHPGGKCAGELAPGIDVKGDGGYIVVAPSIHVSGRRYHWRDGHGPQEREPAALPGWLRLLLCPEWKPDELPLPAGNRPGDDFNRRGDVREVLVAHGWRRCREGENEHWTRPGKSDGTSATLRDGVFYVFTSNAPPFESNRAYSPFSVFALLDCSGDFERAARELGRRGFGAATSSRRAVKAGAPLRRPTSTGPETRAAAPFTPFPLEVLPSVLARFIRETATALGCEPTYVALPTLCVTAAAIGTTRAIELKASWREFAIVWGGLVARSGTLKSPAFDAAVGPLRDAQIDALRVLQVEREQHEREMLEYERALAVWKKSKKGDDPPAKPQAPTARRFIVSDTTIEAVAPILEANPRGVLVARDELAGWIRGFDAYKSKGRGGDAAAWLELWRAGTLIVDRKTGDRRTLYVPRAAVSVCGTIQPGVLASVLSTEHLESGLAARLLLVRPPELPKRWSERSPSAEAIRGYEDVIRALLALQHVEGERGPEPVPLPLSDQARTTWAAFYDRHARRIAQADADHEAAALAKIEAYAARFGLIFALVADTGTTDVSAEAMRAGIALADWFAGETSRVYGALAETDEERELRRLSDWVACHGGAVTPRDISRHLRAYPTPADAEAALERLVQVGIGAWENPAPGERGGRPTRVFRVRRSQPADDRRPAVETAADGPESDVSSASAATAAVASVGGRVGPDWEAA